MQNISLFGKGQEGGGMQGKDKYCGCSGRMVC